MKKDREESERETRRQSEGMAKAHTPQCPLNRRRTTEQSLYAPVNTENPCYSTTSAQRREGSFESVQDSFDLHGVDTSSDGLLVNESHGQYSLTGASSIGGTSTPGMGVSGGYGYHYYKQSSLHQIKGQRMRGRPVSAIPHSEPNGQIATSELRAGSLSMDMIDRSFLGAVNVSSYHDDASKHQQEDVPQGNRYVHAMQRAGEWTYPTVGILTPDSALLAPVHSRTLNRSLCRQECQSGLPCLSSIIEMDHLKHRNQ